MSVRTITCTTTLTHTEVCVRHFRAHFHNVSPCSSIMFIIFFIIIIAVAAVVGYYCIRIHRLTVGAPARRNTPVVETYVSTHVQTIKDRSICAHANSCVYSCVIAKVCELRLLVCVMKK